MRNKTWDITNRVLAAPQIGFCRLLHVPSSERYGDREQCAGDNAHCNVLGVVVTIFGNSWLDSELLQKTNLFIFYYSKHFFKQL